MNLEYSMDSTWAGRSQSPAEIGSKFLHMLDALGAIDPLLSGWGYFDENNVPIGCSIDSLRGSFADFVEAHAWKDDYGKPDPSDGGYMIWASNNYQPRKELGSRSVEALVSAGSDWRNSSSFSVGSSRAVDLDIVTYPLFRAMMLTFLLEWPADWACAQCYASGLTPAEASGDPTFPYSGFQMPWLGYLSADRAARLNVPNGLTAERTADGGLLMIAAKSRLDPAKRDDMTRSKILANIMIEHGGYPEEKQLGLWAPSTGAQ